MTESAAVLLKDGRVLAAAEEERFSRVKHQGGFPYAAVASVLDSEGLTFADIDHIALYWNPFDVGHRARYLLTTLFQNPTLFLEKVSRGFSVMRGVSGEDSGWLSLFQTYRKLTAHFGKSSAQLHFLDHHTCHMASTFYASDFPESAILIIDGAGESACTTWGVGRGTRMEKLAEHKLPHSLGHFYSAVTGYLGFKMLDGEYKVMGLSPYGDPSGSDWIRKNFLRTVEPGRYRLATEMLDYHRALRGFFAGPFVDHFGPPRASGEAEEFLDRHRDVAASAQRAFEEVVLDMASVLRTRTGLSTLCIAGGCGLNCAAMGKILRHGIFEKLYIPPVPHDAGGALGAAMLLYTKLTGKRPEPLYHAQLGPSFSDLEMEKQISVTAGVKAVRLEEHELVTRAAQALAKGDILAWMQGRMEYGPRALGNRSFLADPRSDNVREKLNEKIKKRELFRPFAPSVKEEKVSEYFELTQPSPFMSLIVEVKKGKESIIPAVTHRDNTARPQTVNRQTCPLYWKLLDSFESLTGVPVLLNTSLNIQEPMVCTPAEALSLFVRSGIDAMVLGNFWITPT